MNIGYVSLMLVLIAVALMFWGAYGISKYAFRISSGKGMATLLFPPYTFYFSFYELQEEGKEGPIFVWMWGLVVLIVVTAAFWQPLGYVFSNRAHELSADVGVDAAVEKYKDKSGSAPTPTTPPVEEPAAAPATNNAATNNAATNNGTAGATNAATNGAATNNAPATNGATNTAPAAAATNGAAPK